MVSARLLWPKTYVDEGSIQACGSAADGRVAAIAQRPPSATGNRHARKRPGALASRSHVTHFLWAVIHFVWSGTTSVRVTTCGRTRFLGCRFSAVVWASLALRIDYSSGLRLGEISFSPFKLASFELRGACPVTRLNTREKAAALW